MIYALIIIIGLAFGSFLNVVIYRLPLKRSIVTPGSFCPSCGQPVKFYDNIPVLSYLILKGRCRYCKSRISVRYPLVESLYAVLLIVLFLKFGFSGEFFTYSALTFFLIPISVIDIDRGLILNKLVLPGCILGIILVIILQIETWQSMLYGAAAGGGSAFLIGLLGNFFLKKESMGMGDVKLLILTGIYVGFPGVLLGFFYGVFIAALYIIVRMALKQLKIGETIPFGPFIAIGTLVHILFGKAIILWYLGLF
ncbi:prepilin peptidase [bacterium]|nr:prepilin peptidase [bacterium]